jgi:hypothetical protein
MGESINEALVISSIDEIRKCCKEFDDQLTEKYDPLRKMLEQNILSSDVVSIELHMCQVEAWRVKVVWDMGRAAALTERAKSSAFLPAKSKELTEIDRDAFRRGLAAGFVAWKERLEGLIDCVDSRVNLCKKKLFIEAEGFRGHRRDA